MNTLLQQAIEQKYYAQKALEISQRRLKKASHGSIIFKNMRGTIRCYKYTPENDYQEKYLSLNDHDEIINLVDKRYCLTMSRALEDEINSLDQFIATYNPDKKYDALTSIPEPFRQEIQPIALPPEEKCRIWQNKPFEASTFEMDESKDIRTARGERVRSKSECIIADVLSRCGIAYHYEQKLALPDGNLYPDFTIMHPKTCKLYYLEYFGMMDKPDYAARAFEKIEKYQIAGLDPYLISLFESSQTQLKSITVDAVLKARFGD